MLISELISHLTNAEDMYGNIEVAIYDEYDVFPVGGIGYSERVDDPFRQGLLIISSANNIEEDEIYRIHPGRKKNYWDWGSYPGGDWHNTADF